MSQSPNVHLGESLINYTLNGKYRILAQIGQGGMSAVYKAYQESHDRHVAVKIMHPFLVEEADFVHRFKQEAEALAALNHPHIVTVYDFDAFGQNNYYLVMEYITGGTLRELMDDLALRNTPLSLKRVVHIVAQTADALAYAHFHSIIHRDINAANIMLNEKGEAVLTDFGIVKMMWGHSTIYTAAGAILGTPAYMSPEQGLGESGSAASDIYALGILLFQMTTGQLPFEADTPLAVVMKHVHEPPPSPRSLNPQLPASLQDIILKAMAKSPADRYQTAADMAAALRAVDFSNPTPKQQPDQTPSPLTAPSMPIPETAESLPHPSLPTLTTIICVNCHSPIDVPEHTATATCHACHSQFTLQGHICPYCSAYHEQTTRVCHHCGHAIVRMCHHCNTTNWTGDEHCKTCGQPIDLFEALPSRKQEALRERLQTQIHLIREEEQTTGSSWATQVHTQEERRLEKTRRRHTRQIIRHLVFMLIFLLLIALLFLVMDRVF